ncbi:MAG: DUF2818 family protein [Gammaproteobacteria bacterium]
MTETAVIWIYLAIALVAASLPWLSERIFFVFKPRNPKSPWLRLLEWLVLYFVIGGLGLGLEQRYTGEIYHKGWVFYVVTASLFVVFALPGFIYRYDLSHHLKHRQPRTGG